MNNIDQPVTMNTTEPTATEPIATEPAAIKKRRRWKNGTVVKREIRKLQNSTDSLIPREPFRRLVRELTAELGFKEGRFSVGCMLALQEAAESFLVERFQRADLARRFAGRKTLETKDLTYTQYSDALLPGQDC
jgi:histone H3/H4